MCGVGPPLRSFLDILNLSDLHNRSFFSPQPCACYGLGPDQNSLIGGLVPPRLCAPMLPAISGQDWALLQIPRCAPPSVRCCPCRFGAAAGNLHCACAPPAPVSPPGTQLYCFWWCACACTATPGPVGGVMADGGCCQQGQVACGTDCCECGTVQYSAVQDVQLRLAASACCRMTNATRPMRLAGPMQNTRYRYS